MDDNRLLSQEEIEELIQESKNENKANDVEEELTKEEMDALGEIGNISIGTSATTLYSLLNNKVVITTPEVKVTNMKRLKEAYPMPFITVEVPYTEGLNGSNLMIIKEQDAKVIADLMMGGDGTNTEAELDDLRMSAIGEAMNQMMGSAATSLSTMLKKDINISPPKLNKVDLASDTLDAFFNENDYIVIIRFDMKVGNLLNSKIMQLMEIPFAKTLVQYLYSMSEPTNETNSTDNVELSEDVLSTDSINEILGETNVIETQGNEIEEAIVGQKGKRVLKEEQRQDYSDHHEKVEVKPVQFQSFQEEEHPKQSTSLDLIMDVPLRVTVELGRTKKSIKEILEFGPGSIVELEKLAGEPVDILVNGKLVAKGEVVVIDENFGVRITEIVNSKQRINSLQ